MATLTPTKVDGRSNFASYTVTSTANADTWTINTTGVKDIYIATGLANDSIAVTGTTRTSGTQSVALGTINSGSTSLEISDLNMAEITFTRTGATDGSEVIEYCITPK